MQTVSLIFFGKNNFTTHSNVIKIAELTFRENFREKKMYVCVGSLAVTMQANEVTLREIFREKRNLFVSAPASNDPAS